MKIVKFVLKFLFKFLLLPLVVLMLFGVLFFTVKNAIYLDGEDKLHINYLSQNKEVLDKNNMDFNGFDSVFYDNNIFILSENHGYEDVQDIDFQLFRHLNQKAGVRHYIAEMDSTRANTLNVFLNKKELDVVLLKSVVTDIALRIPQQSSQQLFDKWVHMYHHNKRLNDSAKIVVLGIDQDFNDTLSKISRDSSMLLNFKAIVEKTGAQQAKFYGLFGYYHGMQSGIGKRNAYPFAAKLKRQTDYPQFQKIQTIACLTVEGEMYLPENKEVPSPPDHKTSLFNVDGPILLTQGIKDLKNLTTPNSLTIFHLDNLSTPYKNSQRLAGIKVNVLGDEVLPNNQQQMTTDFYQHVILTRGSKSLSPIE